MEDGWKSDVLVCEAGCTGGKTFSKEGEQYEAKSKLTGRDSASRYRALEKRYQEPQPFWIK